jgi:hypothetical protein
MVEMVGIHQVMWFVMLESAKDRVIGVDTVGQQVPSRVQYEWLAYKLGMLWEVCLAHMSGNLA